MNTPSAILVAACAVAGCSQSTVPEPQNNAPVKFEIRDFKIVVDRSESSANYVGRGTLITTDPRLKAGSYLVWLTVKKGHNNNQESRYAVALRDGVGTIEIRDRLSTGTFEFAYGDIKYSDWKVVGYIPLQPGIMENSPATAASKSAG